MIVFFQFGSAGDSCFVPAFDNLFKDGPGNFGILFSILKICPCRIRIFQYDRDITFLFSFVFCF